MSSSFSSSPSVWPRRLSYTEQTDHLWTICSVWSFALLYQGDIGSVPSGVQLAIRTTNLVPHIFFLFLPSTQWKKQRTVGRYSVLVAAHTYSLSSSWLPCPSLWVTNTVVLHNLQKQSNSLLALTVSIHSTQAYLGANVKWMYSCLHSSIPVEVTERVCL